MTNDTTRPTVLVDQDGVLADFDLRYWDEATRIWNNSAANKTFWPWDIQSLDDQEHRFLNEHLIDPGFGFAVMRELVVNRPGWFASLPPIEGAADGLNELAEHADVWICTKPLEANPTCRDEKAAWLELHMGEGWSKRMITTPNKSLIRGQLLLDDAIKPEEAAVAEWRPVVYDQPFNRSVDTGWARFSWQGGAAPLLDLLD